MSSIANPWCAPADLNQLQWLEDFHPPLSITLVRSERRTVGLRLTRHGLKLSVPGLMSDTAVCNALVKRRAWLHKHWMALHQTPAAAWPHDFDHVSWLGTPLRLVWPARSDYRDDHEWHLPVGQAADVAAYVRSRMQAEARIVLADRLMLGSQRTGLVPSSWGLSNARTRWGSCSSARVVRLNWRLMQLKLACVDYVVIHELCHLAHLNHSPAFWERVAGSCPDWRQHRALLKREAERCFAW